MESIADGHLEIGREKRYSKATQVFFKYNLKLNGSLIVTQLTRCAFKVERGQCELNRGRKAHFCRLATQNLLRRFNKSRYEPRSFVASPFHKGHRGDSRIGLIFYLTSARALEYPRRTSVANTPSPHFSFA